MITGIIGVFIILAISGISIFLSSKIANYVGLFDAKWHPAFKYVAMLSLFGTVSFFTVTALVMILN